MQFFQEDKGPISVNPNDAVPSISVTLPNNKVISQLPRLIDPVLNYSSSKSLGRGSFKGSEYDLAQIGRIRDTENYVSQAFDKKTALMFKEGWNFVGKNPKTVKYIRTRFAQIARASGISTLELFRSLGTNLIQKSNSFVVKVRNAEASGGKVRYDKTYKKRVKPIAGYFPAPSETMEAMTENKKVLKWKQKLPDGFYKEFNPEDVVHFYFNRKDGFLFGTPTLIPVIDDIRALRKIEENIELLVYQHLFPLFQFKVGTPDRPAGYTETGEDEIEVLKREIQYMPSEGGIVTSDRHEIKTIGAEGRALNADKYLAHFERRVIAGLGISSVDLGNADTSNRATADNMSRNLIDSVKDYQQVFESFVDQFIINELLLESTFDFDVFDEDNIVHLKFKEIDISTQIKKEAHYADQFSKDILTHDEARINMGKDPILIPTQEEQENDEDWASKYPDWAKMRWKMFEEPKLIITSIDEPWTLAAKAAQSNQNVAITKKQGNEAAKETKQNTPSPTAGVTTRRKAIKKVLNTTDSFVKEHYLNIENAVTTYLGYRKVYDETWIDKVLRLKLEDIIKELSATQMSYFNNGYLSVIKIGDKYINTSITARLQFEQRSNNYLNNLINDTSLALKRNLLDKESASLGSTAKEVFDTFQWRIDAIEEVEFSKAYNFGVALGLRDSNSQLIVIDGTNDCYKCQQYAKDPIDLLTITTDEIPPYHAHCQCSIKNGIEVIDKVENSTDMVQLTNKRTKAECKQKMVFKLSTMHPEYSARKIQKMAEELCLALEMQEFMEE